MQIVGLITSVSCSIARYNDEKKLISFVTYMYHEAWLVPWYNVVGWSSLVRQEYVSNPTCKHEIQVCSHNHPYYFILFRCRTAG